MPVYFNVGQVVDDMMMWCVAIATMVNAGVRYVFFISLKVGSINPFLQHRDTETQSFYNSFSVYRN